MPKKPINYQNTIMYKIVCNDLSITDTYVGHTTNFVKRKTEHKSNCNNEKSKKHNFKIYQTIRENGGWDNFSMIQIEKYKCNDVFEAKARERYWIEELHSKLNITIPNRSKKEYSQDYREQNRDVILEKNKIYKEKNRDVILEKSKEYYDNNRDVILEKKNIYREKNKDKINQKHLCACGKTYTHNHKSRHFRTKYHIDFETAEKTPEPITEEI